MGPRFFHCPLQHDLPPVDEIADRLHRGSEFFSLWNSIKAWGGANVNRQYIVGYGRTPLANDLVCRVIYAHRLVVIQTGSGGLA